MAANIVVGELDKGATEIMYEVHQSLFQRVVLLFEL